MPQSIDSNLFIKVVFNIGALILFTTILMMIFVIFFKYWSAKKKKKIAIFTQYWENIFETFKEEARIDIQNITTQTKSFILVKLWLHKFKNSDDVLRANLLLLAKKLELKNIILKMFNHKNGNYNIIAIQASKCLKDKQFIPQLYHMIKYHNPLFSLLSIDSLLDISPKETVSDIIDCYIKRDGWTNKKVIEIFKKIDKEYLYQILVDKLKKASCDKILKLIILFVLIDKDKAYNLSKKLIKQYCDEADIVAEALRYINNIDDKDILISYTKHSSWKVRFNAIKSLANMLTLNDINTVSLLLSDRIWQVRHTTAQILVSKEFSKPKYLDELQLSLVDNYAKEALKNIRSKRGVNAYR